MRRTLRIVQLTDLHLRRRADGLIRGVPARTSLEDALADVSACAGGFDRLILTGDLADDGQRRSYQALRDLLEARDLLGRTLLLPGNHDDRGALREVFPEQPGVVAGAVGFSVEEGGWRLIGLDTKVSRRVHGRVGEAQLRWLGQTLAGDDGGGPVALFMHHPPISVATSWLDRVNLRDAETLARAVEPVGRVRASFFGHAHMQADGPFAGAQAHGTPSTVFQFVPGSRFPFAHALAPGYRVIDLGRDGTVDTRVVRFAARKLPRFAIRAAMAILVALCAAIGPRSAAAGEPDRDGGGDGVEITIGAAGGVALQSDQYVTGVDVGVRRLPVPLVELRSITLGGIGADFFSVRQSVHAELAIRIRRAWLSFGAGPSVLYFAPRGDFATFCDKTGLDCDGWEWGLDVGVSAGWRWLGVDLFIGTGNLPLVTILGAVTVEMRT